HRRRRTRSSRPEAVVAMSNAATRPAPTGMLGTRRVDRTGSARRSGEATAAGAPPPPLVVDVAGAEFAPLGAAAASVWLPCDDAGMTWGTFVPSTNTCRPIDGTTWPGMSLAGSPPAPAIANSRYGPF